MPSTTCAGCARIIPAKDTRCPPCRAAQRKARKAQGLTGERGSTRAWRKLRAQVIKRDGGRCTHPGCTETERLEAHHLNGDARDDRMENLALLCSDHHHEVERRKAKA